jgi:hypothetical protein
MSHGGLGVCLRNALALIAIALGLALATTAQAQSTCTTNFCISSQPQSVETPKGWPAVTVEPCCRTAWGGNPSGIDWPNGTPIMICSGNSEYATAYPNCGDPNNRSQPFPLAYDRPTIGIGVAWPNAKDYRYELQTVPLVDGPDGSCARFAKEPGKAANWWVYELKEPVKGTYVFTANVSFRQGEKGYFAVLSNCRLSPPQAAAQ